MRYLPDTNVWIQFVNEKSAKVKERFTRHSKRQILLCDVVKAELYFAAFKSQRVAENLESLAFLFDGIESLPFDGSAARVFGEQRADLEKVGTPIGPLDLQIASIAIVHDCIVVTNNTREFSRVSGLRLEDWETQ